MALTVEVIVKADGVTKFDQTYTVTNGEDITWTANSLTSGFSDSSSNSLVGFYIRPFVKKSGGITSGGGGGKVTIVDNSQFKSFIESNKRH